MASINLRHVVLQDNWPGTPNLNLGTPKGGFDATTWTDATKAGYPIGTKIQVYGDSSGCQGYYTMIYLRYYCISGKNVVEDLTSDWGVFQAFCNSTCLSADGTTAIFTCTNAPTVDTGYKCGTETGVVAVACGTLSNNDDSTEDGAALGGYGWFWCGGVCPATDMAFFDVCAGQGTDITVVGAPTGGSPIHVEADTSVLVFDTSGAAAGQDTCGYALGAT